MLMIYMQYFFILRASIFNKAVTLLENNMLICIRGASIFLAEVTVLSHQQVLMHSLI